MKRSKRVQKNNKRPKVSEMIMKVADDFIGMGKTLEDRRNYLHSACTAWNIACYSGSKREELLERSIKVFKDINNSTEDECRKHEENIRILMQQKDKYYPDVKVQILEAQINVVNGQEHVNIASTKMS